MQAVSDGFTRIALVHREKRTSVSVDDVLFEALSRKEGGDQAALRWIRSSVLDIERMQDQGEPLVVVRNAGLSRLVQRLVIARVTATAPAMAESSPMPAEAVKSSLHEE